jgi:DUF1365 family protein
MRPTPPAAQARLPGDIYVGEVMHHRLRPKRHRFVYRVFTMLLDIDRLDELDRRLRLFSVDRPNLFAFYRRDHGLRDGSGLRAWVERRLGESGITTRPARILLLAMPRLLGYVFNPLSIYYVFDRRDRLIAIIHQVKNTFGAQHAYTLPVDPTARDDRPIRQRCDKAFYVSPFIEADARYHFRLNRPDEKLAVMIRETTAAGPLMIASLAGDRRPLDDGQLLRLALCQPFMTLKVILGIHIEAFRLWRKRIPLQPRPDAGSPDGLMRCHPQARAGSLSQSHPRPESAASPSSRLDTKDGS